MQPDNALRRRSLEQKNKVIGTPDLFLSRQDHLLPLAPPLLELLLGVLPLVLLFPLDRGELLVLDLLRLLHHLGDVPVALDPPDLGHVPVALGQGLVVLEGLALPGGLDTLSLRGVCAP